MAGVGGVLLDLSGVLYVGDAVLPGARDALARLRAHGMPLRFVTNVTREPASMLVERLTSIGIEVRAGELFTAPRAAFDYLHARRLSPYLLVHPAIERELSGLVGERHDAVLLGDAGDGFSYASLNRAFRLIEGGAPLLAMGNNRYFRDADGLSLDIGPFVAALEYATGCDAVILGKPAAEFFLAAVASIGCEPARAVMVGDDAWADVDGALAAGLQAMLVRTGKYRDGDEARITSPGAVVVDDVRAAVERILAST